MRHCNPYRGMTQAQKIYHDPSIPITDDLVFHIFLNALDTVHTGHSAHWTLDTKILRVRVRVHCQVTNCHKLSPTFQSATQPQEHRPPRTLRTITGHPRAKTSTCYSTRIAFGHVFALNRTFRNRFRCFGCAFCGQVLAICKSITMTMTPLLIRVL